MAKLILATNNPHKISEISAILAGLPVEILSVKDFPDFPIIEESGETLMENASLKARAVWDKYHISAVADDTGLEVDFLQGGPGVYSARFAGPACSYDDNNRKLLSLLDGIPEHQRTARFRTVMAFVDKAGVLHLAHGILEGSIATKPRGEFGFGYDPIFVVTGTDRTLAEFPSQKKNEISHRAKALANIRETFIEAFAS